MNISKKKKEILSVQQHEEDKQIYICRYTVCRSRPEPAMVAHRVIKNAYSNIITKHKKNLINAIYRDK